MAALFPWAPSRAALRPGPPTASGTAEMAAEFGLLQSHEISSRVTSGAPSTFESLFGSRSDMGTSLLVRSVGAIEDPAFIIESSVALSRDLVEATSQ